MTRTLTIGSVLALVALMSAGAHGQGSSAARLAQVRDGQVRFSFTLRPGVCGQGSNIWTTGRGRRDWNGRRSQDVDYDVECESGPGRVTIEKDRGEITDLRFYVGGKWHANANATDLGVLSAREAATLLLDIARTGDGKASRNAIFPATVVDSVEIWRDLMKLARDGSRGRETRKQAVFWLGQLAEAPATAGLDELASDRDVDRDVREQAIFALSQRPREEGVPALVKVVRTSKDPELRRKALFWLGQSDDPRALDLIEELLAKR